jgi:hypothetical protein
MSNPFDFPSPFWFGWSLCGVALLITLAVAMARTIPPGSTGAWMFPVGVCIIAMMLCGNAIQERRYQMEHRRKFSTRRLHAEHGTASNS